MEEREEKCRSQKGWRIPGEHFPLNQLSKVHLETEDTSTGLAKVCTRSLGYKLCLLTWCSCELTVVSLTFSFVLGTLLSYWITLSFSGVRSFALCYCIIFLDVCLEVCSFLNGNRGVWIWWRGRGHKQMKWRKEKLWWRCIVWEKIHFQYYKIK